ncbi:putative sugar transporter [Operophtera brumata]|uniref:Putative sugar transporter n=1 Tax=Operophtera brumata TaxID=104452 RepID=A0A0L7KWH2_OPEBR|nr:putative sugar transporter [Operophtera brumata]
MPCTYTCFWALGACLEVVLALVVMQTLGVHGSGCRSIFATIFVIEKFGRKKTMATQFVIFAICVCIRTFLTCILFLARGIIAGLFQAAYVYTPEVLLKNSIAIATGVYSIAALLAAVACLLLPIETKGREMKETITPTMN